MIRLFGLHVVEPLFPETMPTSNALQILNVIIQVNGIIIGSIGLVYVSFISSVNATLSRLYDKFGYPSIDQGSQLIFKRLDKIMTYRRNSIILFAITVIVLLFSIIWAFSSIGWIPLTPEVEATRVGFIWPIGLLVVGLILFIFDVLVVGFQSPE